MTMTQPGLALPNLPTMSRVRRSIRKPARAIYIPRGR